MWWIAVALVCAAFLGFAVRRSMTYLHIFQQEEYDGGRFLRWVAANGAIDRKLTLALIAVGVLDFIPAITRPVPWLVPVLAAACFGVIAWLEADPRKSAKKKLAMTIRARRIFGVALGLAAIVGILVAILVPYTHAWILPVQLMPVLLVIANLLLSPLESRIQKGFWTEAHEKLGRSAVTTVAITGSYGKTSTKHILGHILETAAPTLVTPGSVNTPMGIARIVRESLGTHHRFFVVEMGAYGHGSIERLCRLAPPSFGIITAIGSAHYERYKTLDAVAETKMELATAVSARDGTMVLPTDILGFAAVSRHVAVHGAKTVLCGEGPDAALQIQRVAQTTDGVSVDVVWQATPLTLSAPLYGTHHGHNMALAFATACTLGLAPADVALALKSTPQIAHRLEIKRRADGFTTIDDAYNSNPVGFAAALEVLDLLRPVGGRRILVTPGMVELGTLHDQEHTRIGEIAARTADVLLAVAPTRIPSLIAAYRTHAPSGEIVECATFNDAQAWLSRHAGAKDIVLIENDLPDLFERKLSL